MNRQHEIYEPGDTIPEQPNEELLEQHELEGTPFKAVGNKERGYFLALGRNKLTNEFKDPDEVKDALEKNKWNVIVNLIVQISNLTVNEQIQIFKDIYKSENTENP